MRTLLEEHGGAIATAAVIIVLIGLIVALANMPAVQSLFSNILSQFAAKAQSAAGFGTP